MAFNVLNFIYYITKDNSLHFSLLEVHLSTLMTSEDDYLISLYVLLLVEEFNKYFVKYLLSARCYVRLLG